jgi:acyl dehydratase
MKLKTYITITGKYKGSSKHEFFKQLQIGDTVEVSIELARKQRGRTGGLHATEVFLKNTHLDKNAEYSTSMTMMVKALDKMEYVEQE